MDITLHSFVRSPTAINGNNPPLPVTDGIPPELAPPAVGEEPEPELECAVVPEPALGSGGGAGAEDDGHSTYSTLALPFEHDILPEEDCPTKKVFGQCASDVVLYAGKHVIRELRVSTKEANLKTLLAFSEHLPKCTATSCSINPLATTLSPSSSVPNLLDIFTRKMTSSLSFDASENPIKAVTVFSSNKAEKFVPEETFHCTLGPDPSLRISYTRYPRTDETSKLAFAAHTTTSTFKTTAIIQNKHTFPIKNFILREVIPLSDQDNIQVVLKLPTGLAEAKEKDIVDQKSEKGNLRARWTRTIGGKSGDKEGKYEWLADIGAGDEVKMEVEWEVRAPADFIWGFEFN
ncbi:hypothetical protein BD410DRAFT_896044 [Rickenella mellea]|uniref:DUF4139 domain-containing protein n=1 Tax=Rickenella mellea TaxID=50990 RepID=A0A4Y7QF69_9AGAM|nr:hypothetical protein BD410DRAFT_896044 [Rickenella mellea]